MKRNRKMIILNLALGITDWRVRQAMEVGSQFGWDCPGANPDSYNDLTLDKDPLLDVVERSEKHKQQPV